MGRRVGEHPDVGPNDPWPEDLRSWLAFLETLDCLCHHGIRPSGRLHGVSMAPQWYRLDTNSECPHHGEVVNEASA